MEPTIQTDRGEWLRWDLARSLADDVTAIREELAELDAALEELKSAVANPGSVSE